MPKMVRFFTEKLLRIQYINNILGPSYSLPVEDYLEMKAPMGNANLYEKNYTKADQ